jgi:hypothetical protein
MSRTVVKSRVIPVEHLYLIISYIFLFSSEYRTEDCARIVLDKLEQIGYRVISMTGIGQTCIWLLHKV